MKRIISALLLLIVLSLPCLSLWSPSSMLEADKWSHLFWSAFMAEYEQGRGVSNSQIVIGVGMIGILKEVTDKYIYNNEFDWWDVAADLAGIGAALLIN